jgi:acyl-CoA synthetase (AMP-forming)/AMP-acid ligase II
MPRARDPVERGLASSGRPFAGHEVRIVEPDRNTPVQAGEIGEIQMRGEGVPNPRANNKFGSILTADGWLATSDLGSLAPDGFRTYHGRRSEMLRIGHEMADVDNLIFAATGGQEGRVFLEEWGALT